MGLNNIYLGLPFNYDSHKRLNDFKYNFDRKYTQEECDKVMTVSFNTTGNDCKQLSEELSGIEIRTQQLERSVDQIESNGFEDIKYLQFNDHCLKILEQLDRMGDIRDPMVRESKKDLIQRVKKCLEELRLSSIENLKNLLTTVHSLNKYNQFRHDLQIIDNFIRNESQNASIKDIDDFRFKLDAIYKRL